MAKKIVLLMVVMMVVAACVFVSCSNNPGNNDGSKETWVTTLTETYKDGDVTYTETSTMLLILDGKGNVTAIKNIDTLLADGVDVTDELSEEDGTVTMTGTYKATSDRAGTISFKAAGSSKEISGNYAISGNKLMLSADGESTMFTKK